MAKCDLHVHTIYSEHPSEWFLQRIGAGESYTDPEFVYRTAKARGMQFVTITDHNRIDGAVLLKQRYPEEAFLGVEATTYFPEDGCKIHLLIYGMTPEQFEDIQRLRTDIYQLRDYVHERNLAHSLAHATYSVNGRLDLNHLEKLILLFNVFEGINGGRNRLSNQSWVELLKHLSPERIEDLRRRHRIEPVGTEPWLKGFTGGSDDHAGLFIARTYTVAEGHTVEAYLENLKQQRSFPQGRHNDFQGLVFTVYKVAYDFSRSRKSGLSTPFISQLTEHIFERKVLSIGDKLKVRAFRGSPNNLQRAIAGLVDGLAGHPDQTLEGNLDVLYENVAELSDSFFRNLLDSMAEDLQRGDLFGLIRGLSSTLPGIFLTIPFFHSLRHLYRTRPLIEQMGKQFGQEEKRMDARVLWFTDTLDDMNGVSVTLQKLGWLGYVKGKNLKIVTVLNSDPKRGELPPNVISLPGMHVFSLPYYEQYKLHVPSVLKSLKMVYDYDPDRIIVSTPGPIGLLGLLAGRLMNVPVVGVYHTDFSAQISDIEGNESLTELVESYSRWFFSSMDEIRVPTAEYIRLLEERGLDRSLMKVFRRGIDSTTFRPRLDTADRVRHAFGVPEAFTLIYAGRVSRDKNLDLLLLLHQHLHERGYAVNLILVGDGPYRRELQARSANDPQVFFLGEHPREMLPEFYSVADLFVFPSTTDTFGMVVLEAQACGLPALVSDQGGPQELVNHGNSGYVLSTLDILPWVEQVERLIGMKRNDPESWQRLRDMARQRVLEANSWEHLLEDMMGTAARPEPDAGIYRTTDHAVEVQGFVA